MASVEQIVCFANSRKLNQACIAGKRWNGTEFTNWVRPVTAFGSGEVGHERLYEDGAEPSLLDVIDLGLLEPKPKGCHVEDQLIDTSKRWIRRGSIDFNRARGLVDQLGGPLWVNGYHTGNGTNDSIPGEIAEKMTGSLLLVQPEALSMVATVEGRNFNNPRRRVRGTFTFAAVDYKFSVTDNKIEAEFLEQSEGFSRVSRNPLLCLSVGELFKEQNACYKLIAGVIEQS
jgi:hypothetical protein